MVTIRLARPEELHRLPEIERASGEAFRAIGMPEVADDEPMPPEDLARHHVWVAVTEADEPVGLVVVAPVDGCAHIELVAVHPMHSRRGIGARLLDQVSSWAASVGLPALTLTTFRRVPWNAPYYLRLGFRVLAPDEITPGLAEVVAEEAARGLDPEARVCLRRDVARQ